MSLHVLLWVPLGDVLSSEPQTLQLLKLYASDSKLLRPQWHLGQLLLQAPSCYLRLNKFTERQQHDEDRPIRQESILKIKEKKEKSILSIDVP
jgi:hypothetical protein